MKFKYQNEIFENLHIALWRINVLPRRGHRSNLDCLLPSTVEQFRRIRV